MSYGKSQNLTDVTDIIFKSSKVYKNDLSGNTMGYTLNATINGMTYSYLNSTGPNESISLFGLKDGYSVEILVTRNAPSVSSLASIVSNDLP